ncbi:MAG: hypothetical protein ACUVQY_04290 [Thermoproteota archaeon]
MNLSSRIKATSFMKDYGLGFDDALAVQALKELSMDTIVSWDDDFDSVNWVKRRAPENLLKEWEELFRRRLSFQLFATFKIICRL